VDTETLRIKVDNLNKRAARTGPLIPPKAQFGEMGAGTKKKLRERKKGQGKRNTGELGRSPRGNQGSSAWTLDFKKKVFDGGEKREKKKSNFRQKGWAKRKETTMLALMERGKYQKKKKRSCNRCMKGRKKEGRIPRERDAGKFRVKEKERLQRKRGERSKGGQ